MRWQAKINFGFSALLAGISLVVPGLAGLGRLGTYLCRFIRPEAL